MKKPQTKTIQTIVLLDVLRYLQRNECAEFGISFDPHQCHFTLPDGRDSIFDRVWNLVRDHYHGNQQFCNDSYFRYVFGYEEYRTDDENKLYEACSEALNDINDEFEQVLFEVCW